MSADLNDSQATNNYDSHYQQLKSWYLAHLRKQALDQQDWNLTPAALINADRTLIEGLVMSSTSSQNVLTQAGKTASAARNVAIVMGMTVSLLFIILLSSLNGSLIDTLQIFLNLTLDALLFRGDIPAAYAKAGWLAPAVPLSCFAIPTIMLSMRRSTITVPVLMRVLLLNLLVLVPASLVVTAVATFAASPEASHNDLKLLLGSFAWSGILTALLCLDTISNFIQPQTALLNRLRAAASNCQLVDEAGANNMTSLLDNIVKQRDELMSRETLIVDASSQLLIVLDKNERILACNRAVQWLLGYLPVEVVQKPFANLALTQELSTVKQAMAQCQSSKQAQYFDCRMLTNQKHAVDMRWTLEYSLTHSCYFATGKDVSDEKTLDRAKKEFVSMLGHDIRTPLTSSLLNVQVIKAGIYGSLSEKAELPLANVELSLKRLLLLLEELLEFEQLSAGKMKLNCTVIDISTHVKNALAEVRGQALDKSIELCADLRPCQISGDSGKLMRVLVNLLSNAIKFSPAKSNVDVSVFQAQADTVEVRVKDQGPGIAPEYQKLIFDRYERLVETAEEEGSGLGLAIAKAIVESHGGIIGVVSELGQGSTFWFSLPAQQVKS